MNTRARWLVAAACLLVNTLAFAAEGQPAGSPEESIAAAQSWLKLIDDGEYAESWKAACEKFRLSMTQARWVAGMRKMREPLGYVTSRELAEAKFATEAPRSPPGEYWIVSFKTSFVGAPANEVVVLARDSDAAWRVWNFSIRPAT